MVEPIASISVGAARRTLGFSARRESGLLYLQCDQGQRVKIALAQIDTTIGDFAGNVDLIVKYAECASSRGADLVVFPELALCGYPPRDLVEKPGFIERSQSELLRLARLLPPIPAL